MKALKERNEIHNKKTGENVIQKILLDENDDVDKESDILTECSDEYDDDNETEDGNSEDGNSQGANSQGANSQNANSKDAND